MFFFVGGSPCSQGQLSLISHIKSSSKSVAVMFGVLLVHMHRAEISKAG